MQAKQLNRTLIPLLALLVLAGCISQNKNIPPAPNGGAESVNPAQGVPSPPHYDDDDGDPETIEI